MGFFFVGEVWDDVLGLDGRVIQRGTVICHVF